MSEISINGKEFPSMTDYKIDIEPIGSFERNAKGNLVGDLIAIKTKLNCTWAVLEGEYVNDLMSAVSPFFVSVSYKDVDGSSTTKKMYTSPQSASLSLIERSGKMWWKNVTVNLIER